MDYRRALPSLSALAAFESAARHGNLSRAAAELSTSQPAISRHVKNLEGYLEVHLFIRNRNRILLTVKGRKLQQSIVTAFEEIRGTVARLRQSAGGGRVVITCSYDTAHLWMMPRFEGLQRELPGVNVDIVTSDYLSDVSKYGVDFRIVFGEYDKSDRDIVPLFAGEASVVCSPAFLRKHRSHFAGNQLRNIAGLPLLQLRKEGQNCMTWTEWLRAARSKEAPSEPVQIYNNYVYLLDAACEGKGLALGWRRYVDGYLKDGRLVEPLAKRVRASRGCYIQIVPHGRENPLAAKAIEWLCAAA